MFCQQEAWYNFSLGEAQPTLLRRVEHYLHNISLSTHCTYVFEVCERVELAEQQGSLSYFNFSAGHLNLCYEIRMYSSVKLWYLVQAVTDLTLLNFSPSERMCFY